MLPVLRGDGNIRLILIYAGKGPIPSLCRVRTAPYIEVFFLIPFHPNSTLRGDLPLDLTHASTVQSSPILPVHTSIHPLLNIQVTTLALPFSYPHQWCVVLGQTRQRKHKTKQTITKSLTTLTVVLVPQYPLRVNNPDFLGVRRTTVLINSGSRGRGSTD